MSIRRHCFRSRPKHRCAGRRPTRAALWNRSQRETHPPSRHRQRTQCCRRARLLDDHSGCRTNARHSARTPPRSPARSGGTRAADRRGRPLRASRPRPATSSMPPPRPRPAGPSAAAGPPARARVRDQRRRAPARRGPPQPRSRATPPRPPRARPRGPPPCPRRAAPAGVWARRDRDTGASRSQRTSFAARSAPSPRPIPQLRKSKAHQLGSPSTRLAMMLR